MTPRMCTMKYELTWFVGLKKPLLSLTETLNVEECGEKLKIILESPSIPQANHQLLVHLSRHLARVSQHSQAAPRLLAQAFAEAVFKDSPLRYTFPPLVTLFVYLWTRGCFLPLAAPCCRRFTLPIGVCCIKPQRQY